MKLFDFVEARNTKWPYIILSVIIAFDVIARISMPEWIRFAILMIILCVPSYFLHYFVEKKAWGSVAMIVLGIILYAFVYSYRLLY